MTASATQWERIEAGEGRGRHLVYWHRPMPDRSWLAVAKDGDQWRWVHYGPKRRPNREGGGGVVNASGVAGTSAAAKRRADEHMAPAS